MLKKAWKFFNVIRIYLHRKILITHRILKLLNIRYLIPRNHYLITDACLGQKVVCFIKMMESFHIPKQKRKKSYAFLVEIMTIVIAVVTVVTVVTVITVVTKLNDFTVEVRMK